MTASSRPPSSQRPGRLRRKSPALSLISVGKDEPSHSRRTVIEEHLLDVAAKRFASIGYRQTTLEEIARHAGIAKASMYRYFENKQELLAKIFVKVANTVVKGVQPIQTTALPPEEKLRRAVRHLLHTIGENVSLFTVFYSEEADLPPKLHAEVLEVRRRLAANLENILQEGIGQGCFRPLDAKLIVYAIMGMCGWLHKWYSSSEAPLDDIATAFVGLIERGCLAPRGTEAQAGLTDRLRYVHDLVGSAIEQAERLEKNGQSGRRS